ncbi:MULTISPECIES: YcfL family protein [unclassified Cedecea]|uniref:YcfL family protein n=1 Tax=unclassified Cedecea TaxID=2649846 RepID=UPI00301AB32C
MSRFSLSLLALLLVAGCSSSPAIPVNNDQTLVMESAVLAAGISAEKPDISQQNGATVAESSLYNEQHKPVTLYYRFYWYDKKGLEIHPLEQVRTVTLPGQSSQRIDSTAAWPGAKKVRLSLSVRSEF